MFKPRKEKYRATTDEDSFLTRMWNTEQGRAIIKLSLFGIFALILILIIRIRGEVTSEYFVNYSPSTISYEEKISNLKNNNFDFEYIVTINNNKTIYKGTKENSNESGYKEDGSGIYKYTIEDGIVYKINIDQQEQIYNLYENIDSNYLNVSYVLALIETSTYEKIDNAYIYYVDDKIIKVSFNDNNITNININYSEGIYDLNFRNMG